MNNSRFQDVVATVAVVCMITSNAFCQVFHCGDDITDVDGNTYSTVEIVDQCWMQENLKTLTYPDGSPILDGTGLPTGISGAYYWMYDDNPMNADTFGVLYSWQAAMQNGASSTTVPSGVQGACPDGWHLPSNAEWQILADNFGGSALAGGPLKSTNLWITPNVGATNASGFSGLPGGYRSNGFGGFRVKNEEAFFWTATDPSGFPPPTYRGLAYFDEALRELNDGNAGHGYSVRCLSDNYCSTAQAPDLLNTVDNPASVSLNWNPVPNSVACQVKGTRLSPPGLSGNKRVLGVNVSTVSVPKSLLGAGTTWEWKVRCACSTAPVKSTAFSAADTFSVSTLKNSSSSALIELYPNPAHEVVQISGVEESATIRIFDASGRLITVVRPNGMAQVAIVTRNYLPGVYYVKVQNWSDTQVLKLLIHN